MNDVHLAPEIVDRRIDRRTLLRALRALKRGDFSVQLPLDLTGVDAEIAQAFNDLVEMSQSITRELTRICEAVGKEGQISQRLHVPAAVGSWASGVESLNQLIGNLAHPTAAVARVIESVANGDLAQRMPLEIDGLPLRGEFQRIGQIVNRMVVQLNDFASEVSRVAREVGTEGKLGGQARVPGVAGTWKDLTDHVNAMAENLTGQVRNIAEVTTAVAKGDLSKKITVDVRGEILELKSTVNTMVDQLNGFASEVSRVAREVGTEGKLGGQARVPAVAGTWKDLTDNVNAMAANLTTQVRAIAEVATAVTQGDLTRSIMVEAMGELAALKDNINEMIRNLKDTTLKNNEQDWLKTNLAKFSRMLQGQGDLVAASQLVLSELAPLVHVQQGALYAHLRYGNESQLKLVASYALDPARAPGKTVRFGEGLVGQCAVEKKRILLEDLQPDFVRIASSLGSAVPVNVVILPVLFEGEVKAVIELASLKRFNTTRLSFLEQLAESIGVVFNTIEANMRTRELLAQSQSLTRELQNQQQELKQTNERLGQQAETLQKSESLLKMQQEELRRANDELQHKAELLSEQMRQVEFKNREIELAKAALEEKAEQLALSSRYKSEFLANMSHELRTPLNSLLILAKLLADNPDANLSPKQIDYAQTIYAAGADLLSLISDILDLAKIESGTVTLDFGPLRLADLRDFVERTFRPTALEQKLDFGISIEAQVPEVVETDEKRLQQVLKNLLSNAFKFTTKGSVQLRIVMAAAGWTSGHAQLDAAAQVIAFVVADTGVGIPATKQRVIFEAFQQADGTTSRRYGGTGLGLSISRELTALLGGEITVDSVPGQGSTFVLYLPLPREPALDKAPALAADEAEPTPSALEGVPPPRRPVPVSARKTQLDDDREDIEPGDRVALIVEGDADFSAAALEAAHEQAFKAVIARDGGSALTLAQTLRPDAITLNVRLPDVDGWVVLERLRRDPHTRHIPVSVVAQSDAEHNSLHLGAATAIHGQTAPEALREALQQGVRREPNRSEGDAVGDEALLLADGDPARRAELAQALRRDRLAVSPVGLGAEVLEALQNGPFDCLAVAAELADMSPIELIKRLAESEAVTEMRLVLYSTLISADSEPRDGRAFAEVLTMRKGATRKALLEEIALFLRQALGEREAPRAARSVEEPARGLQNRKVLIVDDDVRNVFALTSALEQRGMTVVNAEGGKEGVEALKRDPDIEMVLMDIMMPELDGYDTIRIIRGYARFKDLPIIALTAKAMKGDREKCLAAGASDYIAKPVNVEQLTSLLRVWLNQ